MKESDKKRFGALLSFLQEAYGTEISRERSRIYFEALMDFSLEQITKAVSEVILESEYFPKISELRKKMLQQAELEFGEHRLLEYKEERISEDQAKKWLQIIYDRLDAPKAVDPKKAEEFEKSRARLKAQVKLLKGGK